MASADVILQMEAYQFHKTGTTRCKITINLDIVVGNDFNAPLSIISVLPKGRESREIVN